MQTARKAGAFLGKQVPFRGTGEKFCKSSGMLVLIPRREMFAGEFPVKSLFFAQMLDEIGKYVYLHPNS
ncbi:MAG: hypothetical protein JWP12_3240 [Bacteroidetes bacterium]|nr:hypothetical protein [Bacteroidota bacterium]